MYRFHEQVPQEHRRIIEFGHRYVLPTAAPGRTIDIGAGLGEHLHYEDLANGEFHAVEMRPEMAAAITRDFPGVTVLVADCQEPLPYAAASFDRAIAVHVLEHLRNLPAVLDEMQRLLKPGGTLSVVIPCEGGLGYALGRRLTVQREFERRYRRATAGTSKAIT